MANDKLTWLELRKAVAEYANTSEQEAGQFLNALLDGVTEGLKTDKQVKIKGLGSFSLKAIAPRRSVNIATGEAFTIEGYNKLTFSAESMLKESVEKRLEQPKTEAIMAELNNDPLKKLGEQADEIIDILAELGQSPTTTELPKAEEPTEMVTDEKTPTIDSTPEEPEVESTIEPIEEPVEEVVDTVEEKFGNDDDSDIPSDEVAEITKGTSIVGNIESDGSVNVYGKIKGDITCKGKYFL